ncbi:MAG: putative DNA binding domain-containing protein [Clostridia bacterium]|nr:putative DNA binding domain-containing protein [Clostridia bacterium]
MIESEQVELKRQYVDDIKNEAIGFLNTNGGAIYVGIDDDGTVVGVDNCEKVMDQVRSSLRNSISPDCGLFVTICSEEIEGKNVVVIKINKGSRTPYYIKSIGPKPSGVYIRIGFSSVQAQEGEILKLIYNNFVSNYETEPSFETDLTFVTCGKAFEEEKVDFSDPKKTSLGMINPVTGEYTNLAYLFSDQCRFSIKCTVFQGSNHSAVLDMQEFKGSVLDQIENTFAFVKLCNRNRYEIKDTRRIDHFDYPAEAIREAIINAVAHREYGIMGSNSVKVFSDRIEVMSLGNVVPGNTADLMKHGQSIQRNPGICNVLHRLHMIEAFGTGIPKIFDMYEESERKPELQFLNGGFLIVLPNQNADSTDSIRQDDQPYNHPTGPSARADAASKVKSRDDILLDYLASHDGITKEDAAGLFAVKPARAYQILEEMKGTALIESRKVGNRKVYYRKTEPQN